MERKFEENLGGSHDHDHNPCVEIAMEIHKVETPPKRSSLQKLKNRLKETFFPDDPLRQFKGQSSKQKWLLGFQYIFPILQWGPHYNLNLFKSDVVSGLTIASLAIPQGISYAKLANLPPIIGLYSSFVPPLVYAVLGSSKDLAVGPVSIASLLMGSMLRQEVSPTQDPLLFLQLAFTSTFFGGLFQASLGFLRLGFIIDFLSKATLIGFMAGAAIIVSLQQLKALLGITHFTKEMGLVPVMSSVFHNTKEWSWQTILMGSFFLVFLLVARHISIKKPKLFWVSAGAPLLSVVLSTIFVFVTKAQHHGIYVIGKLDQGLNPPSWNMLHFHGSHIGLVLKTGLVTGIISLTEGIAVGRTFAALKNYQVDGNKEMIAIGVMNVVGSTTSCYITTGAFSRSAVNHNAGAKTAVSNIIMAVTVMVTLLFLMPLFRYTPNLVLGAIIVTAVIGLIDLPAAYQIWKVDKFDFIVMLCAFFGVIFISVQEGLALAVGISIFKMVLQMTRPKTVVLGNIPGTDIFRNKHQYKDAVSIPGFLILSIQAPISFANSNYLNERLALKITKMTHKQETLLVSGALVAITVLLSLKLFRDHLSHWKKPKEQKAILVIILMAPIYAVDSYVGLLDIRGSETFFVFLDSIKECYEALVMAKFLALLYTYLNISISKNIVPDEIKGREIHHSFPMTLFQPHSVRLNHQNLKLLKYWTWQFVVIRPVCSVLMIVLQLLEIYPDWLSWTFTMILNVSVSLALYALVVFYHVFAKELAPHKPLAKFLCVKGIVFFCFWQGIVLSGLVAVGIIRSDHFWLDVTHIQQALQNALVIVEMVFFAIFQMYAYTAAPYKQLDVKEKKSE